MAADCVCAVVSTQRHAHATLESFLRWHLDGAKFDRVFLYFDHPGDDANSMAIARSPCWAGRVTVIEATEEFREQERYFELPSWHEVSETVNTMVQTRQRLNCEHCVRRHCVSAGAPVWLLHIDADELFMPPIGEVLQITSGDSMPPVAGSLRIEISKRCRTRRQKATTILPP